MSLKGIKIDEKTQKLISVVIDALVLVLPKTRSTNSAATAAKQAAAAEKVKAK